MINAALVFLIVALLGRAPGPEGDGLRRPQSAPTTATAPSSSGDVRFAAIDVFVDAGATPLAAYQFDLKAIAGDVSLVGVEGGEHRAFTSPPYYDPRALSQQRIIVAAFDTGSDLPVGRTRVARLMVQIRGPIQPAYDVTLIVAGSADARAIPASVSVAHARSEGANR